MVKVHVEYCSRWGYGRRFEQLKRMIEAVAPDAEVKGVVGRLGSFEISIDGELAFSKLNNPVLCGFMTKMPDFEEVVEVVKKATGKQ